MNYKIKDISTKESDLEEIFINLLKNNTFNSCAFILFMFN